MRARFRRVPLLALALGTTFVASPSRGDDWPQFRRDGQHTAQAKDRLHLPLTEIWSVPATASALWHGRAFYVNPNPDPAQLVCADARTGATIWHANLYSRSILLDRSGLPHHVAVSEGGVVFTSDWQMRFRGIAPASANDNDESPGPHVDCFVRAFRALDGRPIDQIPNLAFGLGPVNATTLVDGGALASPVIQPFTRSGLLAGGQFLVSGETAFWSSINGRDINSWSPGATLDGRRVLHLAPDPRADPRQILTRGYVLTQTPLGVLAGGQFEEVSPTMALSSLVGLLQGSTFLWHWDFPWLMGTAASDHGMILAGSGNMAADRTLLALDATSGTPLWSYPRAPFPDIRFNVSGMASGQVPTAPNRRAPSGAAKLDATSRFFSWSYSGTRVASNPGNAEEPRLAVNDGRVFWSHGSGLSCVDQESGAPLWEYMTHNGTQPPEVVNDLIGVGKYLVTTTTSHLENRKKLYQIVVLRQDTGEVVWRNVLSRTSDLAAADGLVFLQGPRLNALAPAERTFLLAVDSDRPDDYDATPLSNAIEEALPPTTGPEATKPDEATHPAEAARVAAPPRNGAIGKPNAVDGKLAEAPPDPPRSHALADAMILRLSADLPEPEMFRRIRERRRVHPELPLLLSLDWLDDRREQRIPLSRSRGADRDFAELQALCGRLAEEARPARFDVAPEVNVYLARHPDQLDTVARYLRGVRQELALHSPGSQMLASYNVEVLRGLYGKGDDRPFGAVPTSSEEQRQATVGLWSLVDEVGLTTYLQSAFRKPEDVPGDHLFGLKPWIGEKHVLVTRIGARLDENTPEGEARQAAFLKHAIRTVYWMDAALIAYPDAFAAAKPNRAADFTLLNATTERAAAAVWRDTLAWKRVPRLSSPAAAGPR